MNATDRIQVSHNESLNQGERNQRTTLAEFADR